MQKWGWGSEKTRKFLRLLHTDEMIKFEADKRVTTIKIINYEEYQNQNGSNVVIPTDIRTSRMKTGRKQNEVRTQTE